MLSFLYGRCLGKSINSILIAFISEFEPKWMDLCFHMKRAETYCPNLLNMSRSKCVWCVRPCSPIVHGSCWHSFVVSLISMFGFATHTSTNSDLSHIIIIVLCVCVRLSGCRSFVFTLRMTLERSSLSFDRVAKTQKTLSAAFGP